MHPFPLRPPLRGFRLQFFAGLLVLTTAFATPDDDRVAGLNEQIHTLETVVAGTKESSEKIRLNDKLQRLQQELKIIQDRAVLEARERALTAGRALNTLDQLREKLRGIDVAVDDVEHRLNELERLRRLAAKERDSLSAELAALRNEKGTSADRIVELEERITTKGEELRALALEYEAGEAALDIAHDATQLRERIKAADTSADRPTLRELFESFSRLRAVQKNGDQLGAAATDLKQKLAVSQDALDLSRQKLAKYDEELSLLEKDTGIFRRDERIERLLAQQRNQKASLNARLPWLVRQVDAIQSIQQAVLTREDLATLKASFEDENYSRLKAAYLHRLRWPLAALAGLLGLQLVGSYALLPLTFKNESLFLARRFVRYIIVLLGACVVAGFLFADLSMIVATLGIVSAALVISLQDVCASIAGWAVILVGGKFGIGDRVEIDGTRGDVIDIQLLRTTMLEINGWLGADQPTGRVIVLPNNFIFKFKVFNFTHGHPFIWGKIDLTITFGTLAGPATALFQRVLEEETQSEFEEARRAAATMQRRYGVEDADYKPKITIGIGDNGVVLSLFYVAHYRRVTVTRNRLSQRLIAELEHHREIQLAFQTLQLVHSPADPMTANGTLGTKLPQRSASMGGN